jgi:hypothetical protein
MRVRVRVAPFFVKVYAAVIFFCTCALVFVRHGFILFKYNNIIIKTFYEKEVSLRVHETHMYVLPAAVRTRSWSLH